MASAAFFCQHFHKYQAWYFWTWRRDPWRDSYAALVTIRWISWWLSVECPCPICSMYSIIYLHNWVIYGVNVGVHIPAPWFAYGCGLAQNSWQITRSPGHHGRRPRNGVQRAGPGQFCRCFLCWMPLELAMKWTWFDWQIWHEIWHGFEEWNNT